IVSQGLRPSTALVTDRGVAEGFAISRARNIGGEPRVFSFQVTKESLKNPGGRPSYYFVSNKFELVTGVSQAVDDSLTPFVRVIVQAERRGDKVKFATIRAKLWDEITDLEGLKRIGELDSAGEVRILELRAWLSSGITEDGFRDVLMAIAESDLGLRVPKGATADTIITMITETVDVPISRLGVLKNWVQSERGGGSLRFPMGSRYTESEIEVIFNENSGLIRGMIKKRLEGRGLSGMEDDLLMTVFEKFITKAPRMDSEKRIKAWLSVVAKNETASFFRLSSERKVSRLSDLASTFDVDEVIVRGELNETLKRAIESLSPVQKRMVVSRYVDDLTIAATARRFGTTEGNVRSASMRGVRRIKAFLDREQGGGFLPDITGALINQVK
ncbi:hypothetical protein LCGC14_2892320, partial [marine sediment metagenome]